MRGADNILVCGMTWIVARLYFCSSTAAERERGIGQVTFRRGTDWTRAIICIVAGILSPSSNFALICGDNIRQQ
jgi:hypothetical protein